MDVVTETVEPVEGVLVKATEVGLEDGDSVTTVVDNGTSNKGERAIGGREGDDTIAVGVGEGDEGDEKICRWRLARRTLVNRTQSARLLRSVCGSGGPQDRRIKRDSGNDMDCTEGEAARMGDS
jgi:hypothetical protein